MKGLVLFLLFLSFSLVNANLYHRDIVNPFQDPPPTSTPSASSASATSQSSTSSSSSSSSTSASSTSATSDTSTTSNTSTSASSATQPPPTSSDPATTAPPQIVTDPNGTSLTVTVTSSSSATSGSASPSTSSEPDDSSSGLGTGSIIGLSVAGGIAVIGIIAFFVWKFTRKRFSDFDDNEAIKWPDLNTHGASGGDSHPLPVNNTGRAGFDTGSEGSLSRVPSTNYSTTDFSGAGSDPYAVPPLPHLNPNQPYRDDPSGASGYYDPYRGPIPGTIEHGAAAAAPGAWGGEAIPMTQMNATGRMSPGPNMAYGGEPGYEYDAAAAAAGRQSPGPQMAYGGRTSPGPQAAYGGRTSPGPQTAYGGGRMSPGPHGAYVGGAIPNYGGR